MIRNRSIIARAYRALLATATLLPLAACDPLAGGESATRTSFGEAVPVGLGIARTYLITFPGGEPIELGVVLSEAALEGLPSDHTGGIVMPDGHTTHEYLLPLPGGNPTPFRHVMLNWNLGGHEPPGTYDLPHFDFHFYTITEAERHAIDPADPEFQQKAERVPASDFVPEGYVLPAPLAFARMGVHWVDPASPELNGSTFTTTFIHGSWNGKVIFWEPMVTREFLRTRPDFRAPIPRPRRVREASYYPGEYRVRWDATTREYRVTLGGFDMRS